MQQTVKMANTNDEYIACFEVIKYLRPHLNQQQFLELMPKIISEGYQLAYIETNIGVVALAGFRLSHNLFMGKNLYVDDLITLESERSKGYGETLMQWLRKIAVEEGCTKLHLDSGTHRGEAHKFYFRQGLTIASYHFSEDI